MFMVSNIEFAVVRILHDMIGYQVTFDVFSSLAHRKDIQYIYNLKVNRCYYSTIDYSAYNL